MPDVTNLLGQALIAILESAYAWKSDLQRRELCGHAPSAIHHFTQISVDVNVFKNVYTPRACASSRTGKRNHWPIGMYLTSLPAEPGSRRLQISFPSGIAAYTYQHCGSAMYMPIALLPNGLRNTCPRQPTEVSFFHAVRQPVQLFKAIVLSIAMVLVARQIYPLPAC